MTWLILILTAAALTALVVLKTPWFARLIMGGMYEFMILEIVEKTDKTT